MEAEGMLHELMQQRHKISLHHAPEKMHEGHKIRVVEQVSPEWYSDLYFSYLRCRSRPVTQQEREEGDRRRIVKMHRVWNISRTVRSLDRIMCDNDNEGLPWLKQENGMSDCGRTRSIILERLLKGYTIQGLRIPPNDEILAWNANGRPTEYIWTPRMPVRYLHGGIQRLFIRELKEMTEEFERARAQRGVRIPENDKRPRWYADLRHIMPSNFSKSRPRLWFKNIFTDRDNWTPRNTPPKYGMLYRVKDAGTYSNPIHEVDRKIGTKGKWVIVKYTPTQAEKEWQSREKGNIGGEYHIRRICMEHLIKGYAPRGLKPSPEAVQYFLKSPEVMNALRENNPLLYL